MFGYGRFCLRVSPYCAFVSVLATDGSLRSQPLSRYFDLELFYREVTPLLPQLRANNYRIGVTVGAKLKRVSAVSLPPCLPLSLSRSLSFPSLSLSLSGALPHSSVSPLQLYACWGF